MGSEVRPVAIASRLVKKHARPFVSANFAITWDGRISTRSRTPSDFSSKRDKQRFLELRALADAVFVTPKTAAADGMTMRVTSRKLRAERVARGQSPAPLRVIVSRSGKVEAGLPVFSKRGAQIVIFATERMPRTMQDELSAKAEVRVCEGRDLDLAWMLSTLRKEFGVKKAHCEGGGTLLRALLEADLLDELYLTLCPRIFGSRTAATLTGPPGNFLPKSSQLKLMEMQPERGECFLRYRVQRS